MLGAEPPLIETSFHFLSIDSLVAIFLLAVLTTKFS